MIIKRMINLWRWHVGNFIRATSKKYDSYLRRKSKVNFIIGEDSLRYSTEDPPPPEFMSYDSHYGCRIKEINHSGYEIKYFDHYKAGSAFRGYNIPNQTIILYPSGIKSVHLKS